MSLLIHGLSPHTRGSRGEGADVDADPGSIPAHTGKPTTRWATGTATRVYPRTHGEAAGRGARRWRSRGLSPHTRGSLLARRVSRNRLGSIPAHTGKPLFLAKWRLCRRVYPRTHGEAGVGLTPAEWEMGLSPHTRGSPNQGPVRREGQGSIPAHTGKPHCAVRRARAPWVYPRTHGEATERRAPARDDSGLSPHTRGSLSADAADGQRGGSIPAHTGKPATRRARGCCPRVYPRTHGEAASLFASEKNGRGLSPHTRGSLPASLVPGVGNGSIPAHTGKPPQDRRRIGRIWVYPRTHGEAGYEKLYAKAEEGLSPHTRGSPMPSKCPNRDTGSIPAHTGKPVYPPRSGGP